MDNNSNQNIENNIIENSNNGIYDNSIKPNVNPNVVTVKTIITKPKNTSVNPPLENIDNKDLSNGGVIPPIEPNKNGKKNKGTDILIYILMVIIIIVIIFLLLKYCSNVKNDGKGMITTTTTQTTTTTTKKNELSTNTTTSTTTIPISTATTSSTTTKKVELVTTTKKTTTKITKKPTTKTTTTITTTTKKTTTSTTTTKKVDKYTYTFVAGPELTGSYVLTVYLNGSRISGTGMLIGTDEKSFSSSTNGQFTITGGIQGAKDIASCKNISIMLLVDGEKKTYTVYPASGCPNF